MFGDAQVIEDGATGARLTVRRTDDGVVPTAVVLEVLLPGGARARWSHVLRHYDKRIEVLHGALAVGATVLEAGGRVAVPAGESPSLQNEGRGETHFVCELKACDLKARVQADDLASALEFARLRD
jgi:hypothetical protein